MDLRKLRYFCRVVEAGSMSRAAASLNVAQPALSKSIQALEAEMETGLLQRTSKGACPTEAGERLYEHAQIIFTQIDRARAEVRRTTQRPSGHVIVGMPHSVTQRLGMPLLKAATARYPLIRMEIAQDQSHILPARLRSGRVDFAVSAAQRPSAEITAAPLLVEELFLVMPADPTLPARASISFEDAARLSYVLPSLSNGLRTTAESLFKARSLPLNVRYEVDAIALIPECVRAGLGATILPGGCIGPEMAARMLVVPFTESCHRTLVVSQPASQAPTPAASAIIGLARDVTRELVADNAWLGAKLVEPTA